MSFDVIETRLKEYQPKTKEEEINALKEICQEIALCGLARSEFFKTGAFQGGTCLRILFGLKRFSEDLDFILLASGKAFKWEQYLKSIQLEFRSFGLSLEVQDRSEVEGVVKKAFLKENSLGKLLNLRHKLLPSDRQSIKIKLEIDVNPPEGSTYKTQYLVYPYPFSVLCQDLPSLFASKCHALLCRTFVKGRDWFDFLWYVSRQTSVNFKLLENALFQMGPFQGKKLAVDLEWLVKHLQLKIEKIDWSEVRLDIENFLRQEDRRYVESWNRELFVSALNNFELQMTAQEIKKLK